MYDPEKIILGGAISSRPDFIDKINEKIDIIMKNVQEGKVRPIMKSVNLKMMQIY